MPVYAPAQQNAMGEYVARVGDATWSGTGDGALQAKDAKQSKNLFQEGGFSIADTGSFPVRSNNIDKGSFGRGFIGRDSDGNPVEAVLYRGTDDKLYSIDQATIERFKQDPVLSKKLDGYVTQFSPTEIRGLVKESTPFTEDRIGGESKVTSFQEKADASQAESDRLQNMGFFGKLKEGFNIMAERGKVAKETRKSSFFENKNTPTPPEEGAVGDSANKIVEQGKSFFRTNPLTKPFVEGFLGKKQ